MKRKFTTLFLALVMSLALLPATVFAASGNIPTNGLQCWYRFDETNGPTASDSSGNGNYGMVKTGSAWSANGKYGGAISFANHGGVDIPSMSFSGDFTVGAWIKFNNTPSNYDALVGQGGSGQDINFYDTRCRLYDGSSDIIVANTPATAGVWLHIALTRSGSTLTMYVNGVSDATASWSGVFTPKVVGSGNYFPMNGSIDDFVLYNRALGASEIVQLRDQSASGTAPAPDASPTSTVGAGKTDANNGDWSAKTTTLKNTGEAGLMVRVGDIDALNDTSAIANGYNPFTAKDQRSHGYPWDLDPSDPMGTDRIYLGSHWKGVTYDGYSQCYADYKNGGSQGKAYGDGALTIAMNYSASGIAVNNALLQLCVDDFQAPSHGSNFTVTLNGKDAPFIAELLNHIDQSGPVSYMISAAIPSGFFSDISSGKLVITIDETTGAGDGYAVDFAKLLVNYNADLFTGEFSGTTEPGATVRLLGTSTTVTAAADGSFNFKAVPGLNAVRASKNGYKENYQYGIVLSSGTEWNPNVPLNAGTGSPDIDFSKFAATDAWANASPWATPELQKADDLGLIPDSLRGSDLTQPITRAEFAAVSVKAYEALTGIKAIPVSNNPFKDTSDVEVLKAYNLNLVNGTSATTFEPNTILNRESAATLLTRVLKAAYIPGWTLATDSNFTLSFMQPAKFADDDKISDWAKSSVYFMAANGIITGTGNNMFSPRATTTAEIAVGYASATREQALIIALRMVDNLKDKPLNFQ